MLKEKLKMMNGVLENGNYQLGQFKFGELRKSELTELKVKNASCLKGKKMGIRKCFLQGGD